MAQTIRISTGYSDKASENYNSKQFSVNLELDVQVNGNTREIEDASDRLFSLCRKIVEKQKGISVDNLLNYSISVQQQNPQTAPITLPIPNNTSQNSNTPYRRATSKQIKYLFQLAQKAGLSNEQTIALAGQYYGKQSLNDLSSQEASNLIDSLADHKKAA